jgi:hypothetical protein
VSNALPLTGGTVTGATTFNNQVTINGASSSGYTGFKNRIINGGMIIWQRGTTYTGNPSLTNVAYGSADRWCFYSATSMTGNQSTDVPSGFQYSLKLQRPAAATTTNSIYGFQIIESVNMRDLAGQTVVVSFWAKAGANLSSTSSQLGTGVITGTVADQGSATSLGAWTGSATSGSLLQSLTTTWTKYSYTATVAANALEMNLYFAFTPTGTAGADDSVYITGVQLERGSNATSFEFRDYGSELQRCYRYFVQYSVTATAGNVAFVTSGYMFNTTQYESVYIYPVEMRTAPTLTTNALSNFTLRLTGGTISLIALYQPNTKSGLLYTTNAAGGSLGYGQALIVNSSSTGILNFSAEL